MIPQDADNTTTARPRPRDHTPLPAAHDGAPIPPHDDGAEMCVVGALLIAAQYDLPHLMAKVAEAMPDTAAMYGLMPRVIYGGMLAVHRAGQPVDGVTVASHLRSTGYAGMRDVDTYMRQAAECIPHPQHAMGYVDTVASLWRRRVAISALHGATQGLLDGATVESVTATVTEAMTRITPRTAEPVEPPPPRIPFPIDALPQVVAEYVQAVAAALPCAHETVALPLLSTLAAATGNSRRISLKSSWTEPSVIWTATILSSGKLKSPAHEKAVQFLTRRECKLIAKYKLDLRKYESELENYEAEKSHRKKSKTFTGELPPPPEMPTCERLTTGDTTVEALADLLAENERGILVERDELAGWFASFDRYSNGSGGDLAAYLSMHRAGSMTVDRKTGKRVTYIERAAVSVTGTIQPGTIRRCLTPEYFESGLPARILLAMPDSPPRRWSEDTVSPAIEQAMDDLAESLLNLQMDAMLDDSGNEYHQPIVMPLSPEAKVLWIEFYNSHAEDQESLADDRESSAWSKLEAYAARFALIFSLCRNPDAADIDPQSMADGIRLTRWFCNETRRVYAMLAESPGESRENALVSLIRNKFGGRVTPKELWQSSRKYRPTSEAEKALEKLIAAGYGKWEVTTPDGACKPKTEFVLFEVVTPVTVTLPPKTKGISSNVTSNHVTTSKNDISQPPDDDGPPVAYLENQAAAELARQEESEELI